MSEEKVDSKVFYRAGEVPQEGLYACVKCGNYLPHLLVVPAGAANPLSKCNRCDGDEWMKI